MGHVLKRETAKRISGLFRSVGEGRNLVTEQTRHDWFLSPLPQSYGAWQLLLLPLEKPR